MAAKVTNCYRFQNVDFEPQTRLLIWQDHAMTHLSEDECRLLNVLCRHAGETLSFQALFRAARFPTTSFEQHQNNLSSLLAKSYHCGKKSLPVELVSNYGYRIALPKETFAKKNEQLIAELDPSFMTAKQPSIKPQNQEQDVTNSHSRSRSLTILVGVFSFFSLLLLYLLIVN